MLSLARLSIRRPRSALITWAVIGAVLAVVGFGVTKTMSPSVSVVQKSESMKAQTLANQQFGPTQLMPILLEGPKAQLDKQGPALVKALVTRPHTRALSAWDAGTSSTGLRPGPNQAMIVVAVDRSEKDVVKYDAPQIQNLVSRTISAPVRHYVTGQPILDRALNNASMDNLRRDEAIAVGIVFLLLLIGLRAPMAAFMVTAVGGVSMLAAFGEVTLLGHFMKLDTVGIALGTMTGLILGVGFSLLILDRFHREEFPDGVHPRNVVSAAMKELETTGRAVLIAGTAIIVSLLLVAVIGPTELMVSLGTGMTTAAIFAVGGAVVVMPAGLVLLGHRINWLSFPAPKPLRWAWSTLVEGGAKLTGRKPYAAFVGIGAIAVLAVLALPVRDLKVGPATPNQLPKDSQARIAFTEISRVMGPGWPTPYSIVIHAKGRPITDPKTLAAIDSFQNQIAKNHTAVAVVQGPGQINTISAQLKSFEPGLKHSVALGKQSKKDLLTLINGLGQAGSGSQQLQSGLAAAATGAGQLQNGGGLAVNGAAAVHSGAAQLHAGSAQAQDGAGQLSTGLDQALSGANQLKDGAGQALGGAQQLVAGLAQAHTGAGQAVFALNGINSLAGQTSSQINGAAGSVSSASGSVQNALGAVQSIKGSGANKQAAIQAINSAIGEIDAASKQVSGASGSAKQLSQTASAVADQAPALVNGLQQLHDGAAQLENGIAQLRDGNSQLAGGMSQLANGGGQLHGGLGQLTDGLAQLQDGSGQLQTGLQALAGGAGQLAAGLSGAVGPTGQLVTGLGQMQAGVTKSRNQLPSTADLEKLFQQAPGMFTNGYFVLAAVNGALPADRNGATFMLNVDKGGTTGQVVVYPKYAYTDKRTQALQTQLIAMSKTFANKNNAEVAVGGPAANLLDQMNLTKDQIWLDVAVMAAAVALILMVALRAVALPLVAAASGVLASGAAFGVLQLLFGGSNPPLGGPGWMDPMSVIGIFTVAFGLSAVYSTVLLMRTRERFVLDGSNKAAVRTGLRETAAATTGAGVVMVAALVPFATTNLINVRQFGVGVAVAIILDVLIVRPVLLPAAEAVLGRLGWWPTKGPVGPPSEAPTAVKSRKRHWHLPHPHMPHRHPRTAH